MGIRQMDGLPWLLPRGKEAGRMERWQIEKTSVGKGVILRFMNSMVKTLNNSRVRQQLGRW
jgi:hypothetical protein